MYTRETNSALPGRRNGKDSRNPLSRQKGTTISELVRTSLQEHYMLGKGLDKAALARNLAGIWKNRKDQQDIDAAVRKLRKGSRLKRLHIG